MFDSDTKAIARKRLRLVFIAPFAGAIWPLTFIAVAIYNAIKWWKQLP